MRDWLVSHRAYYAGGDVLNAPILVVSVYTPPRIWRALVV